MRHDYLRMLDSLKEGVYFVDLDRVITFWNKGAERITGYSAAEVLGRSCKENILVHVDCNGAEMCTQQCPLSHTMRDGTSRESEFFLHHRRGHRVPIVVRTTPLEDDDGAIVGGIELFSEINPEENMRRQMQELEKRALLDMLTQVPNRSYLDSELAGLFQLHERSGVPFGILFCDIDHFKRFNDTYGHDVGDLTLQTVANSLRASARSFDVVGRWGGEEFVCLFPNADPHVLGEIAERLCMAVRKSWVDVNEERVAVTISIGGTCPTDSDTPKTLVKRADALMYSSKQNGRDRVTIG